MTYRRAPLLLALTVAMSACSALLASPAYAFKITQGFVRPTGQISISPDRYEGDVTPGQTLNLPMVVLNKTSQTLDITVDPTDIGPSKDPGSLVTAVSHNRFGAVTWMRIERRQFRLKSGEQASLNVAVMPPTDAPVGSNFAGILVSSASVADPKLKTQQVSAHIQGLVQLFFTVPGAIVHDTRIDAADVADTFVFRGDRFVSYDVIVSNHGNVNDHVQGHIRVTSMFGNSVVSLPLRDTIVLRGAKRELRVVWTNPPWFGRFSARAELKSGDPDRPELNRSFAAVIILPPWWVVAALLLAIAAGIGYGIHHRRNAWKQYLDDDWDDEFDDGLDDDAERA